MEINTIVLLVGMIIWGSIQCMSIIVTQRYMNQMMNLMTRITDVAIKAYEKLIED